MNVRKLYDKRYSLYERAVTYEGTELNSITGACAHRRRRYRFLGRQQGVVFLLQ